MRHGVDEWPLFEYFAIAVLPKHVTLTLNREPYAEAHVEAGVYEQDTQVEADIQDGDFTPRILVVGSCLEIIHLDCYDPWAD